MPSHHSSGVEAALRDVVAAEQITAAMRRAEDLAAAATRSTQPSADAGLLATAVRESDDVTALAAMHALGGVASPVADQLLLDAVRSRNEPFAGHAAWVLAARRSSTSAASELVELVVGGGFTGMLAERTLIEWSRAGNRSVQGMLRAALLDARLGAVRGLGGAREVSARLLGTIAALPAGGGGLDHRRAHLAGPGGETGGGGLTVIQPFLHARLDRDGTSLGAGDGGGIASLLRSLGTALADEQGIDEVVTITRAHPSTAGMEPLSDHLGRGHRIERIEFGPDEPGQAGLPWRDAWAYRTVLERELSAIGRQLAGRRVVWHLRMADVGTLAAAAAARRLGQPVVFTAAPDPHVVIDALQSDGRLRRDGFAREDASSQYWFRARMVERLTAQVDRLVLMPRPTIHRELVELLGLGEVDLAERAITVPEGIDIAESDRALARAAGGATSAAVQRVMTMIPAHRRHLPWLVSIGRLSPFKGPHRIVAALAADPALAARCNLVLIGGDLDQPSPEERSTLELISRASGGLGAGTVTIVGHLPPAAVTDLLVHAAHHDGVYVCASDKEEFGLAIVEALAAGLPVVAPQRGGPGTYVHDGRFGILCDTTSVAALGAAIHRATTLAGDDERAVAARAFVRAELSVNRMAERLAELYRVTAPAQADAA